MVTEHFRLKPFMVYTKQSFPPAVPRFLAVAVALIALAALTAGCRSKPDKVFRFYQEQTAVTMLGDGLKGTLPLSGAEFTVGRTPILFEGDVEAIELVQVDLGLCVLFQFGEAGSRELYRASVRGTGRRIFLFINDVPFGARRMDGPISDGALYMFLEVPDSELPDLVEEMKVSLKQVKRLK